jgi:predicted NUDIX family NTP pyrophosphohydrolase
LKDGVEDSPPPPRQKRSRVSAGLLIFRRQDIIQVLLAHPGGPFFARKDDGVWTIPKGEAGPDEDLLTRARIEVEEEIGIKPSGEEWIPLGSIKQKGGKTVHAWAVEGDLPERFELKSNFFEIEYPPRSGQFREFPEIDRAEFFPEEIARQKINPAQIPFLDRLRDALATK